MAAALGATFLPEAVLLYLGLLPLTLGVKAAWGCGGTVTTARRRCGAGGPVVLIALGVLILIEGGAFGL